MKLKQPLDANAYRLAQRLLTMPKHEGDQERRRQPRQLYQAMQRIAPCSGDEFPDWSEFFEVQCHDINSAGLGFLLPTRPQFDRFIIELGLQPDVIYVLGEVIHATEVLAYTSGRLERLDVENGIYEPIETADDKATEMVLVGCQMLGRREKPFVL